MKNEITSGHICCGAGGDILGAKMAGIKPIWAFDINTNALDSVNANHPDVARFIMDIRILMTRRLNLLALTPVDIAICGIPCQPFTRIGRQLKEKDDRDISVSLARLLAQLLPGYIIFENVKEYERSQGFKTLNTSLENCGYSLSWKVLNVADYGIPQRRKRLLGIAFKGKCPDIPKATHGKDITLWNNLKPWKKFKDIKDGTGMRPLSVKAIRGVLRRLARHSAKGNGFSVQIIDDSDIMMTVLGTMWRGSGTSSHSTLIWDNGIIRNVSFLEARRAQGFPDEYIFCGSEKEKWQMVANAIPPNMAKILIESIIKCEYMKGI